MADKKMRKLKVKKSKMDGMIDMGDNRPAFSITEEHLPQIKKWNVKEKYNLEIEVEMTGSNIREYEKGKPISATFKITGIKDDTDSDELKKAKRGYE